MRSEEGWQSLEVGSGVVGSGDIEMQAPFQKPGGSEDMLSQSRLYKASLTVQLIDALKLRPRINCSETNST